MLKGIRFFVKQGWKYSKRYVLWNILYQFVNSFIPILAALMPKYMIDELMGAQRTSVIIGYIGILAGYTLIASVLSSYFNMDGFTRRCIVSAEFDSDLHRRLAGSDFENLENPAFLDMQEKAKKFLYCDWHGFGYLLDCALNIVGQVITLLGVAWIIATLNVWIILLFVILALAGTWIEGAAKKKAMSLSLAVTADQRGWMYYSKLFDDYRCGKEVRIYRMEKWLCNRERQFFTRVNRNIKQQNDTYIQSAAWGAIFSFIQQGAAYLYLTWQAAHNLIGIGSFTMYIGAVTVFAASFRKVMDSFLEIRAYDLYYDQLDEYLEVPQKLRNSGKTKIKPQEHSIEFRNVGFRYSGAETWALRNIDIIIHPGEKLSVVGENGSGKTTFVKLLTRLYDPTEGDIYLDGINIREIDYDSYMSLFSTVFQDYQLFSFSLKDNVALGLEADGEKIKNVLHRAGLGKKLSCLPKGIETAVYKNFDPDGFEPSGGEGQRIALARALHKDAPIMILDEPAAALDPRAEFELYQHFHELTENKTAVYISHRMSSSRFCDRVIVFENGRIVETGTHEQLMAQGKIYAELYQMQAQFYQ